LDERPVRDDVVDLMTEDERGDIELPEDEDTIELAIDVFGRAVVPEGVAEAEPEDLALALEAVCFSLNRAVTLGEVGAILGRTPAAVSAAAQALADQLRGRGLMLQRHGDQLQLVTRPQTAWAVQRALQPERPTRLSRPALETLAIVAYRQPLTRAGIEAIRGVNCEAVLDNLERRGLVAEVDRQDSPGRPRLFGTTMRFLQIVGLERIDDLPPLDGADLAGPLAAAAEGVPLT
jgi:segregation and condensation protein B